MTLPIADGMQSRRDVPTAIASPAITCKAEKSRINTVAGANHTATAGVGNAGGFSPGFKWRNTSHMTRSTTALQARAPRPVPSAKSSRRPKLGPVVVAQTAIPVAMSPST